MADLLYVHDGSASDAAIVTLLETEHTVTQHDVNGGVDPIPGDAGDYDCIVLGNGLGSDEIGTSYRDLAVPVVAAAGSSSWTTPLELTSSLSSTGSSTTIAVPEATHEIAVAAGLMVGNETIADSNHSIFRADGLGPEADSIAYHFQATRHTFFAYESGAEMANSVLAPARRVALGFIVAADTLTALGEACALESVTWAIGAAGGDEAITASLSSSFSLSASILDAIEDLAATLSAAFSASADNFTIYISKFVSLVTSFAASASVGTSLPAAISATLAWSIDLTASASSVLQRIATASLRTTFSLLGSASGVPSALVSGATDIVVSSVNFIRTGATFITGSMRNIFRKD